MSERRQVGGYIFFNTVEKHSFSVLEDFFGQTIKPIPKNRLEVVCSLFSPYYLYLDGLLNFLVSVVTVLTHGLKPVREEYL